MFSILIKTFSFKFINYFISNINYNKIIIFLKQTIIFRILGSRNLGSSAMTHAPGVPQWGTGMAYSQRNPSTTCALGVTRPQAGSLSAICAQLQEVYLQPGAWGLLVAASHMPLLNSAVHSESTYILQYPRYSSEQYNPQ